MLGCILLGRKIRFVWVYMYAVGCSYYEYLVVAYVTRDHVYIRPSLLMPKQRGIQRVKTKIKVTGNVFGLLCYIMPNVTRTDHLCWFSIELSPNKSIIIYLCLCPFKILILSQMHHYRLCKSLPSWSIYFPHIKLNCR